MSTRFVYGLRFSSVSSVSDDLFGVVPPFLVSFFWG